jgi:hypothetical protein
MSSEFYGIVFIIFVGAIFAVYFAGQTFREPVAIQGVPTALEYLVRRRPLLLGQFAFVLFCLAIYVFALVFYKQLPQIAEFLPDAAKDALKGLLKLIGSPDSPSNGASVSASDKSSSLLVIVFAITTTFLYFVRTSFKGNIIFSFRSLLHSWMAVPVACKHATDQLLENLTVPEAERADLQSDPRFHVSENDFEESAGPIRRQWAKLAYMNYWARRQKRDDLANSFRFDHLERQFIALRELTRVLESDVDDQEAILAAPELLRSLRAKYARYMACILMNLSSSRRDFYDRCREVGIDPGILAVENPLWYSALFIITLVAAIAIGPYLIAVGYDLIQGKGFAAITGQHFGYFRRWLILGFAIYFLPIFIVLLARYVSWRWSHEREQISVAIYAWIFLGVLAIAFVGAILATLFLNHGYPANWTWDLVGEAAWRNAPWMFAPAATAVYINYYLDRQADPSKDDIEQSKRTIIPRLLMALAYTFGIALLSLVIVAYQQLSEGAWPQPETQVIVVGTTALVNLSLCLVAQFGLKKPEPDSEDAEEYDG